MHPTKVLFTLAIPLSALLLTGCFENPADDVAKAEVSETDPASTETATSTEPSLPPNVQTYVFEAGSKLGFVGSKVTGSHEGGFNNFTGYFNVDVANAVLDPNSFHAVMIDMGSVYTDNEKLTGHLKNADFFDVEKFPTARFELNKATTEDGKNYSLAGTLELHGETKKIEFPATVTVADDQSSVDVQSEFAINRSDFGITYKGMADDLIREEVVIRFDVQAAPGEKRALELGGTTGSGEAQQPERRGPGGGGQRPDPSQMIANLDQNNDGMISQEEAPERAWQFLSQADTDGDGLLSLEELQNRPRPQFGGPGGGDGERRQRDPAAMLERMDANKDGKITEDEVPERFWQFLSGADKDKDGAISLEELTEMPAPQGGRGPGGGGGPGGGMRAPGGGGPGGGQGGMRGPGGGGPGGGGGQRGDGQGATDGGGGAEPTRPALEE